MNLLILGIDGGDREIINIMDMPFTQQLIRDRVTLPIKEDLWSRGWSELSSGMHGIDTGAFYSKPKLDGSIDFTQSYRSTDYLNVPNCVPIWDRINQLGYSVGFLNMPTTMPAPKVEGFFIAGAGSGFSPSSRVPDIACYPREIANHLLGLDYIWEQRFKVSGVRDFDLFIEKCIKAVIQRSELFISLCEKYDIDVGFLMHREFSTLTNLFANIISRILTKNKVTTRVEMRIAHFYRVLDDFLKFVVSELDPKHIIVISDHSTSQYLYSLNLNAFLDKTGFLRFYKKRSPRKPVGLLLKTSVFKYLRRLIIRNPHEATTDWVTHMIDYQNSLAFSNNYVPGIFINDERFLGRANSFEKKLLIKDIVKEFNNSPEAKSYKLFAKPYKELYEGRHSYDLLPDIWIDVPETVFPEQRGEFIQKNPYNKSYEDLSYAHRDIMSGIKGRNALCCIEKEFIDDLDLNSSYDLTVAYQMVLNHLIN